MNRPAYEECYLESMKQKSRYLFRLIARNCPNCFEVISAYMQGEYRRNMDLGNPLYLNKTPKQILGSLHITPNPDAGISEAYDEFILDWMADIYVYLQWKYRLWSGELVKVIVPENLYEKYYPLHETSLENGADKLVKIYGLQIHHSISHAPHLNT